MTEKDGVQVFPAGDCLAWETVTLRDYFAAHAIGEWIRALAQVPIELGRTTETIINGATELAGITADAMLKEREKEKEDE